MSQPGFTPAGRRSRSTLVEAVQNLVDLEALCAKRVLMFLAGRTDSSALKTSQTARRAMLKFATERNARIDPLLSDEAYAVVMLTSKRERKDWDATVDLRAGTCTCRFFKTKLQ